MPKDPTEGETPPDGPAVTAASPPEPGAADPATSDQIHTGDLVAGAASEPTPAEAKADEIIGRFTDSLRNSPVSRMTEAWNHLFTVSLPALRADLIKEL